MAQTARIAGATLLLLLGLARGFGGVMLLVRGPALVPVTRATRDETNLLALGLFVVAYLAIWAGLAAFFRRSYSVRLAYVAVVLFVAGGVLNGLVLYGSPRPAGVAGNVAVALVIALLAFAGRRSIPRSARDGGT